MEKWEETQDGIIVSYQEQNLIHPLDFTKCPTIKITWEIFEHCLNAVNMNDTEPLGGLKPPDNLPPPERDAGETTSLPAKRKRGKPRATDESIEEDLAYGKRWEYAKYHDKVSRQEFCTKEEITVEEHERILDRNRKRKARNN